MTGGKEKLSQTIRLDIPPDFFRKVEEKAEPKLEGETPAPGAEETAHGVVAQDSNFHALFQRVYDGALIVDLEGQIVEANERSVEFLQYRQPEFRALGIVDIISGADAALMRTLRDNLAKDIFTLIQAYCRRKDGTFFQAEIAVNMLPLSGRDYLFFFIRDVTLRRQAEDLLRIEHSAIQIAGNGIAMASLDGTFEFVNQAVLRLWHIDRMDDVLGRTIRDLFADGAVVDAMVTAVREGRPWTGYAVARRKDNSEFNVQISAAGNRNTEDELVSMVLSFMDVSDAQRAEEAERQAERQRIMMESLGTACHHLGQPATVVLASLEVMRKLSQSNPNQLVKEVLDSGMEAAESLRNMLHKLNAMTEYKTRPYLKYKDGSDSMETRILDFPESAAPPPADRSGPAP
jgi:PAS domain S-box-containing protein